METFPASENGKGHQVKTEYDEIEIKTEAVTVHPEFSEEPPGEMNEELVETDEENLDPRLSVIVKYIEDRRLDMLVTVVKNQRIVIHHKQPERFHPVVHNLVMVVQKSGEDLLLLLYTFNLQIWKDHIIYNYFNKENSNSVISKTILTFLEELVPDMYNICAGAFAEVKPKLYYSVLSCILRFVISE